MAEAIVSAAIRRIADLLVSEAAFLYSATEEVERLQAELKRMKCFLKDADQKQEKDERVRNRIAEIRDVAYEAEDAVDTFILKVATKQVSACGFIDRCASMFSKGPVLHEIGTQVESIQRKIRDISTSMQTYDIRFIGEGERSKSANEMQRRLRRSYPHEQEDHIFGFESITKDLKLRLMSEDDQLRVVSIVGMGGTGKTTLAKKIYNDIDIKQHFNCYSWAFISQHFSLRDVLLGILMDVGCKEGRNLPEDKLIETLKKELEKKRYLVVLDDIWGNEVWASLKPAFPNGKEGSKVLLTTRIQGVTSHADPMSSPVKPPLLTNKEGWALLSKKAFARDERSFPLEFEDLGTKMVGKCGGLPLAILVLGGLLATKKTLNEWEKVLKSVSTQFMKLQEQQGYAGVYEILALSYHDLPSHLKPCFLYLSQFPKNWEIKKKELIRLWIAEGFVSQPLQGEAEGDATMEDIGEEYLEELISRSMVQVSKRSSTGMGVKTCQMHDVMRDMCISIARDENFLHVVQLQEESMTQRSPSILHVTTTTTTKPRRITVHPRIYQRNAGKMPCLPLVECDMHLRSLLYFVEGRGCMMKRHQGMFIFKNFKLLRVLNLRNVQEVLVPSDIDYLIHLRYLGLRDAAIERLPASIGNMKSLYTLDLRSYLFRSPTIPNVLWKLENLRHLLVEYNSVSDGIYKMDTLRNLETLTWIRATNLISNDTIFKLTNLRNLGIYFDRTEEVEVVLRDLVSGFSRLRSMKMVMYRNEKSFPNLEPLSRHENLIKIELRGKIPEDVHGLHHNLGFLPRSLVKLILRYSQLKQDPMAILADLPNLKFLSLVNAYQGSQIYCSAHGFSQLETLRLSYLMNVEEWRVEKGAMPSLKYLRIHFLSKLRMIPEEMRFVTSLQKLSLINMPKAFKGRVRVVDGVGGEDFDKVRHIHSIIF